MIDINYTILYGALPIEVELKSGATLIATNNHAAFGSYSFTGISNGYYTIYFTDAANCTGSTNINAPYYEQVSDYSCFLNSTIDPSEPYFQFNWGNGGTPRAYSTTTDTWFFTATTGQSAAFDAAIASQSSGNTIYVNIKNASGTTVARWLTGNLIQAGWYQSIQNHSVVYSIAGTYNLNETYCFSFEKVGAPTTTTTTTAAPTTTTTTTAAPTTTTTTTAAPTTTTTTTLLTGTTYYRVYNVYNSNDYVNLCPSGGTELTDIYSKISGDTLREGVQYYFSNGDNYSGTTGWYSEEVRYDSNLSVTNSGYTNAYTDLVRDGYSSNDIDLDNINRTTWWSDLTVGNYLLAYFENDPSKLEAGPIYSKSHTSNYSRVLYSSYLKDTIMSLDGNVVVFGEFVEPLYVKDTSGTDYGYIYPNGVYYKVGDC